MRKIIVFSVIYFLIMTSIKAQVIVEGININKLEKVKICQVVAQGKLFSKKVTITIDYGQEIKWSSNKGSQIRDENGEMRKFNTVIEAINYMENNGWEYINVAVTTIWTGKSGNIEVYNYYFRRKE